MTQKLPEIRSHYKAFRTSCGVVEFQHVFPALFHRCIASTPLIHIKAGVIVEFTDIYGIMDNLHYRLIFDLAKSRRNKRNFREEPFKSSKIWLKNVWKT